MSRRYAAIPRTGLTKWCYRLSHYAAQQRYCETNRQWSTTIHQLLVLVISISCSFVSVSLFSYCFELDKSPLKVLNSIGPIFVGLYDNPTRRFPITSNILCLNKLLVTSQKLGIINETRSPKCKLPNPNE